MTEGNAAGHLGNPFDWSEAANASAFPSAKIHDGQWVALIVSILLIVVGFMALFRYHSLFDAR